MLQNRFKLGVLTALLSAVTATTASAQGRVMPDRIIPESSIEQPKDVGLRAHTNIQIYAGRQAGVVSPMTGLGPAGGLSPAQLRSAYSLPSAGGSQIIAIVDAYDDPNALSDFNTFSAQFGLPQETSTSITASTNRVFQVVYGNGSKPAVDSTGGWELEESLDIEWAHAMAPSAKIVLVESLDNTYVNLFASVQTATNYVDGNGTKVAEVSNSWGGSEWSGETANDVYFTSTSITYFCSAGDSGAPAQYPSSSPYVVSVGGTTVNTTGSGAFSSETGWASGGGGPSTYETTPSYQSIITSKVGASRGTPDIAFDANPSTGASVYDSYAYSGHVYGWLVVGGTSLASPAIAGVANVAATSAGAFPAGSQALLTTIYGNLGSSNFRDITSGNNGYAAGVGWDFVTGVGSPLGLIGFQRVVAAPAISSVSPGSVSAGGSSFTLTVTGAGFVTGSVVDWNGTALVTTFVSSTVLTASVPASDIASAGTIAITAANPGSGASNALSFTVTNSAPTVSSLSPNTARHGSSQISVVITGTGFNSASTVSWKNGTATTSLSVTGRTSTTLTVTVPRSLLSNAGTASVTVTNPLPGGGASAPATFTIQ